MLRGRIRGSARKLAVFLTGIALLTTSAAAADIKLVSLRFSVERPVPHLHLEGPIVGGDAERLEKAIEKYTSCAGSCKTGYAGGSRAVVSLSGQSGSLEEGLRVASVLERNLATSYVAADDSCLSACAVAFLGGTAFWATGGVGKYTDRLIEPGARLGFNLNFIADAPQHDGTSKSFLKSERARIAQFVDALDYYGVHSTVYSDIIRATLEEAWVADTPSRLYAIRALLPAFDPTLLGTDIETQLRNVCAVLLARHYGTSIEWQDKVLKTQEFRSGTDTLDRSIKMLGVDDVPYHVTGCGTSEDELTLPLEKVHLYQMVDAVNGLDAPFLSMVNPLNKGWAQIYYPGGSGSNPHEILALSAVRKNRAVLNHLLIKPNQKLADLPLTVQADIKSGRYVDEAAQFPMHQSDWPLSLVSEAEASKVYEGDGLVVVERVGTGDLFDGLIEDSERTEVSYEYNLPNVAVRSGIDTSHGTSYYWLALRDGEQAATIRIEAIGQPSGFSAKQRGVSAVIACGVRFGAAKLACKQ